jgi:hypothetical protein
MHPKRAPPRVLTTIVAVFTVFCARSAAAAHPSTVFDGAGLERLQAARNDSAHAELTRALEANLSAQV